MVHEIQDKRVKKLQAGPSTKDGRGLKKRIGRKKAALYKLLDELYLWKVIGTDQSVDDHRLPDTVVKEMLKTGQGPWQAGVGAAMYWGKLASRCEADLARIAETLPVLFAEKRRAELYVSRTLSAINVRLVAVGEGSGRGILLCRWKKLMGDFSEQLENLNWNM